MLKQHHNSRNYNLVAEENVTTVNANAAALVLHLKFVVKLLEIKYYEQK